VRDASDDEQIGAEIGDETLEVFASERMEKQNLLLCQWSAGSMLP